MVHLGFQGREHSPGFFLFLKPEEPSILYHHSWRCYRTPAEVIIQQENHLSMLVISDCKQEEFFWVLEAFSPQFAAAWRTRTGPECSGVWPHMASEARTLLPWMSEVYAGRLKFSSSSGYWQGWGSGVLVKFLYAWLSWQMARRKSGYVLALCSMSFAIISKKSLGTWVFLGNSRTEASWCFHSWTSKWKANETQ